MDNDYDYLPLNELLELLEDYGSSHKVVHAAARRIRHLKHAALNAAQTLRNLSNGDLAGDAAEIAKNTASSLDKAAA